MKIRNPSLMFNMPLTGTMDIVSEERVYRVYVQEDTCDSYELTWNQSPPDGAEELVLNHITRFWRE